MALWNDELIIAIIKGFSGAMALQNDALIIAIIKGSSNLRYLEIDGNDIGDEVTEVLAHTCHKLEYLDPVMASNPNELK